MFLKKVTDYELKPGGRNIRVTEETKHEYVDLVADHILTNAIRPQIHSFLEGFNELVPPELISFFNDKELELLISGALFKKGPMHKYSRMGCLLSRPSRP